MKVPTLLCLSLTISLAGLASAGVKLPERDDSQPLKWWQEDIIYQIYPRSHQDSDDDGIGDLKGIESRLDHFVDIGIGSVWISPIYKSPMKDFGYDISNFTDIEPQFGTIEDFRSLSRAMKERGLKLIMDFVPNHSSDEHPWFAKSIKKEGKYTDYYVWKDAKGRNASGHPIPPNNWVQHFGGSSWQWNEERQQFYLHQFVVGQPDLNYYSNDLNIEMLAAMKFWLDEGVDGFRMDAVQTLWEHPDLLDEPPLDEKDRPDFATEFDHSYWNHTYTINQQPHILDTLAKFRDLIDIYSAVDGKERCMMTEQYLETLELTLEYYGTKERPVAHFPFNFDLIRYVNKDSGAGDVARYIDEWYTKMPEWATANWLVGNHDNKRVGTRFGEDSIDKMNMIILLLPGASVTYYGEEIGMVDHVISWEDTVDPAGCNTGPERYHLFSRDPERTPMQWNAEDGAGFSRAEKTWLPINPNHKERSVNVDEERSNEGLTHLKVYKQLSELRKTPTWKYGSLETRLTNGDTVFGFSRISGTQGFLVLNNFSDEKQTVDASVFENVPEKAIVYTTSVNFEPPVALGSTIEDTKAVEIGPKHSIVLTFCTEDC